MGNLYFLNRKTNSILRICPRQEDEEYFRDTYRKRDYEEIILKSNPNIPIAQEISVEKLNDMISERTIELNGLRDIRGYLGEEA